MEKPQIKQKPEDFIVEEVLKDKLKREGNYSLYVLKKKGMDTLVCLKQISDKLKIQLNKFGYCGLKDKKGITYQYISLPSNIKKQTLVERDFSFYYVGQIIFPLQRGDNAGNNFIIKVHSINKTNILKNIEEIKAKGFLNYYDSQRTGDMPVEKSVGYYLLKKDFKNALLYYYIGKSKHSHKPIKKELKKLFTLWPKIPKKISLPWQLEKPLLYLQKRPGHYKGAILNIHGPELELLLGAFQALIWNKIAEQYAKQKNIAEEFIPLPTEKQYDNKEIESIYQNVLKEIKFSIKDFENAKELKLKLNYGKRRLIIMPENLTVKFERNNAVFTFFLPAGCYATMLVKAITKISD